MRRFIILPTIAIMVLAEIYRDLKLDKISDLCGELSSGIYYWHVLVLSVISNMLSKFDDYYWYQLVKPILVIVITVSMVLVFTQGIKRLWGSADNN